MNNNIDDTFNNYDKPKTYRRIEFQLSSKTNTTFVIDSINKLDTTNVKANLNNSISNPKSKNSFEDIGLFDPKILDGIISWSKPNRVGPGLFNQGNTCFLNATLQCLFYIAPLTQVLLSDEFSQKALRNIPLNADNNNNNKPVVLHYRRLVSEIFKAKNSVSPRGIIQNIRKIGKQFRLSRQEDAHEFLVQLLDCMHEEVLKACNIKSTSGKISETTFISRIFGSYLCSEVSCPKCDYISKTYNYSLCLSLDINQINNIDKAIDIFLKSEQLSIGNEWKCDKCNKLVKAMKKTSITQFPKILILHLKRFAYSGNNFIGGKINKHIRFEQKLSIKSNNVISQYELCGLIVHIGSSAHSGHYIAFIKASNGTWNVMDDTTVRGVSIETVLRQNAYVLFYNQVQPIDKNLHLIEKKQDQLLLKENVVDNTKLKPKQSIDVKPHIVPANIPIDNENFTTEELNYLVISNKNNNSSNNIKTEEKISNENNSIKKKDDSDLIKSDLNDEVISNSDTSLPGKYRLVTIASYTIKTMNWPASLRKLNLIRRGRRQKLRNSNSFNQKNCHNLESDTDTQDMIIDNNVFDNSHLQAIESDDLIDDNNGSIDDSLSSTTEDYDDNYKNFSNGLNEIFNHVKTVPTNLMKNGGVLSNRNKSYGNIEMNQNISQNDISNDNNSKRNIEINQNSSQNVISNDDKNKSKRTLNFQNNSTNSNENSNGVDIVKLLKKLSERGKNIGSEGSWDNTDETIDNITLNTINTINNKINENERNFIKSKQVNEYNKLLDSGKIKKIKNKNIDNINNNNKINKFQEYQNKKQRLD